MKIKKLDKNVPQWTKRNVTNIPIGFCATKKAYKRLMKTYKINGELGRYPVSHACFFSMVNSKTGQKFGVINISTGLRGRTRVALYALLAHEMYHCFNWLMATIKEEKPSEELGAYLFQSIYQDILELYEATK